MNFLLKALVTTDAQIMYWALCASRWISGWVSQRRQEQFLIVAHTLIGAYQIQEMRGFSRVAAYGLLAFTIPIFWMLHRSPDSVRIYRMLSFSWILLRISYVFFAIFYAFLSLLLHPWDEEKIFAFKLFVPSAIYYLAAISRNGDGEGKKRKMDLDKIKALFGSSWITSPLPVPQ